MLKKTAAFLMILMMVLPPYLVCNAQTPPPPPVSTPEKRQPILMRWKSLEGIRYFYGGVGVKDRDELKNIISPLHDYEADQLLTHSKDEANAGTVCVIGGLALLLGGAIIVGTDPNIQSNPNSIDGQETAGSIVGLAGLIIGFVGTFKIVDGKADEFNAIQRYNEVVYKESQTSWLRPQPGVRADLLTFKF